MGMLRTHSAARNTENEYGTNVIVASFAFFLVLLWGLGSFKPTATGCSLSGVHSIYLRLAEIALKFI